VRLGGIKQTALAPEVGISRQALVLIESSGLLAGPGGRRRDRA
jgi:DNA-binding XRE family transcriptional regulator